MLMRFAPSLSVPRPVRNLRMSTALHTVVVFGRILEGKLRIITDWDPSSSATNDNYEDSIRFCLDKPDLQVQYEPFISSRLYT